VGIDEPRHQCHPTDVDNPGVFVLDLRPAYFGNSVVVDKHCSIRQQLAPLGVQDRGAPKQDGL
jgi:hypothetical protein